MQMNSFTPKVADTVMVEKILVDLIPGFLKNKTDDLHFIHLLILQNDYEKIKRIGHNWKGACPSYGFHYLGEVGQQFEQLVQNREYENLKSLVDSLNDYLQNIKVEYANEH